jgi:AcrR family transcriptional regulator
MPTPSTDEIQAPAEDTRNRLVDVTSSLLADSGDHALRLADVARDAGVAVSTIYAHFRDRTDLVAEARLRQFRAHADAATAAADEALGQIDDAASFRKATDWPDLANPDDADARARRWDRLEAMADARHLSELADKVGELQRTVDGRAAEVVRAGQRVSVVDPELDPTAVSLLWQSLKLGLTLRDLAGDGAAPDPTAWATVMERVADALGAPPD